MSLLRPPVAADHGPLTVPPAAPRRRGVPALGAAAGLTGMVCVGGSVVVSSVLAGGPVFTAEAVRYAGACLLLLLLARVTGRRLAMPAEPSGSGWAASR